MLPAAVPHPAALGGTRSWHTEEIPFQYFSLARGWPLASVFPMNFECDPGKNQGNLAKHGLSLEAAEALWTVPGVEADLGLVNGEFRYARLAPLGGSVHLAVFTFRSGPVIRLISARPATAKEIQFYESKRKK